MSGHVVEKFAFGGWRRGSNSAGYTDFNNMDGAIDTEDNGNLQFELTPPAPTLPPPAAGLLLLVAAAAEILRFFLFFCVSISLPYANIVFDASITTEVASCVNVLLARR